jgi:SRSO17 transposase
MNSVNRSWNASDLRAFHELFAPLFGRREAQEHSWRYLQGLLTRQGRRRSARSIVESVAKDTRALERFVSRSPWSDREVVGKLQAYLAGHLGGVDAAFAVHEGFFPKKGKKSVGVSRVPVMGAVQRGVFLVYSSANGIATVDRRLYLPREWIGNEARRRGAGVPEQVAYRSLPDLALEMLREARRLGALPGRWVTAGDGFGRNAEFRNGLRDKGWTFVVEAPADTEVLEIERGRHATTIRDLAKRLPDHSWEELPLLGPQAPRHQVARVRVRDLGSEAREDEAWLVILATPRGEHPRCCLSNAPPDVGLEELACLGALPWTAAAELDRLRHEVGLDEYAVRGWRGWHNHTALALLAGAFLRVHGRTEG